MTLLMKLSLFVFFACLFVNDSLAQKGYHIVYHRYHTADDRVDTTFYHLVFNDSMAYSYIRNTRQTSLPQYNENDSIFGGDIADHHDEFYLPSLHESFHLVHYKGSQKKFKKRNPVKYNNFIVQDSSFNDLGLMCKEGYAIKSSGDTLFAVIASDIYYPYGPTGYAGLPGLVVEMYDTEYRFYVKMTNIYSGNYYIQFPKLKTRKLKSNY